MSLSFTQLWSRMSAGLMTIDFAVMLRLTNEKRGKNVPENRAKNGGARVPFRTRCASLLANFCRAPTWWACVNFLLHLRTNYLLLFFPQGQFQILFCAILILFHSHATFSPALVQFFLQTTQLKRATA